MWIPGFGKYVAQAGNRVGDMAPDFELTDDGGNRVRLSEQFGDRAVVLVFYPKADTPG